MDGVAPIKLVVTHLSDTQSGRTGLWSPKSLFARDSLLKNMVLERRSRIRLSQGDYCAVSSLLQDKACTFSPRVRLLNSRVSLPQVFQIHLEAPAGDVLVFLTGQEEIEAMERLVKERAARLPEGAQRVTVAPIFSAMPADQQMRVFQPAPPGTRKVGHVAMLGNFRDLIELCHSVLRWLECENAGSEAVRTPLGRLFVCSEERSRPRVVSQAEDCSSLRSPVGFFQLEKPVCHSELEVIADAEQNLPSKKLLSFTLAGSHQLLESTI